VNRPAEGRRILGGDDRAVKARGAFGCQFVEGLRCDAERGGVVLAATVKLPDLR
jgi:hypothetical protein